MYVYKFLSKWIQDGESDILQKESKHIYVHPNSNDPRTSTGDCWMQQQINFKKVKISNNQSHGDVRVYACRARLRYANISFSRSY